MGAKWTDADKRWSGESESTIRYYEALQARAQKAEAEVEQLRQEVEYLEWLSRGMTIWEGNNKEAFRRYKEQPERAGGEG